MAKESGDLRTGNENNFITNIYMYKFTYIHTHIHTYIHTCVYAIGDLNGRCMSAKSTALTQTTAYTNDATDMSRNMSAAKKRAPEYKHLRMIAVVMKTTVRLKIKERLIL